MRRTPRGGRGCRAELCASLLRYLPNQLEQQSGDDGTGTGWIWLLMVAETRSAVKENVGVGNFSLEAT